MKRCKLPCLNEKQISQRNAHFGTQIPGGADWKAYDGLVLKGYEHHRIHDHQNQFARGKNHVNGIESIWSYAKFRFLKLRGVRKDRFLLHLKECEWRLTIAALNFTHCSFRSSAKTLSQLHKTHLYLADTPGLLIMAFYF